MPADTEVCKDSSAWYLALDVQRARVHAVILAVRQFVARVCSVSKFVDHQPLKNLIPVVSANCTIMQGDDN